MPDDLERAAASGQRSDGSSAISLRAIFDATLDGIVVVRTAALRPDRLGEDRPQLTPDETDDEEAFGAAPTEVIDVNLGFERLFGHSRDAAIGRDLNDLNLWTDLGARAQMAGELARQGHVHNLEAELRRKDGTAVCCLLSAAQVMIAGERFIVGLARDISLRKQNQRRLEESEATFRKLFDSNLDSMLLIDVADNQITAVNKRMLTASGYTQEELIGQPWSKLEMQSDGDVAVRIVQGLQQHGEIRNLETVARLKNGTTVPCLVSATLLELRGRLSCLLVIRDIAAIKAAEQQLIEARETALAASRAKSEFLSSMSHEIRTPLNVVLGMADLLAETRLDPDQRKYLNTMVSNGNLLLELINDILDLAKVEAGHLELDHTPFNLVEVTDRVCETLAVRAHVHHLELVSHVLPDTPVALIGDPLRLRQILINLLGNAIKFTEAGSVVLTVAKVREVAGKAELHFRVTDTGVGIAADKIDRIFDSFNQADSSTPRQYGGTGLGLAIVKRLIEVMGGRTWVESEVGKGSTFHFTVPFELESDCTMQSESARAPLDLSGVRTMVVDDTAANRVILREMLAAKGARVTEADSGRAALAAYAEALRSGTPFELLVLDCRMPEVDGLSVARHIGAMPDQGVAILMLTSDDLSMRPVHMRKLGIQAHLVKPIRRADLYHAISSAMAKARRNAPVTVLVREPAAASGQRTSRNQGRRQPSAKVPAAGHTEASGLRILLVEDLLDNRVLIQAYLKATPHRVEIAENGQVAVEKFTSGAYDLVLMDMRMPVMDGYTATREIRRIESEQGMARTPIIALTASALKDDVRKSIDSGCDLHIPKPVKKAPLLSVVREIARSGPLDLGSRPREGVLRAADTEPRASTKF